MRASTVTAIDARVLPAPPVRRLVRSLWERCSGELCTVGRPRPLAWARALVPRRRAIVRLANNECSLGTYKVARLDGRRTWIIEPLKSDKDECTIQDAMDMF